MIKIHKYIPCANDGTVIWHYFSLSHFLWMIENRRLHFTRADGFEDKYELAIPEMDAKCIWGKNINSAKKGKFVEGVKKRTFINCWAMSDHELALMWKSYSSVTEGIAIKSTVMRIKESYKGDATIYPFIVQYKNSNEMATPLGHRCNDYWFAITKRKLFEQEKEMRLVYYSDEYMGKRPLKDFSIEIDLKELIEEVHIAPNAEKWFVDLVRSVCKSYGLEKIPVVKSEMI